MIATPPETTQAGDRRRLNYTSRRRPRRRDAVRAGSATAASASVSRLVTEALQHRRVAGAELGEDPLVEDDGDDRDQHEVEGDAELDRQGRPARELDRADARPFSTITIPSSWWSVARRVATTAAPNATSASIARSACSESRPTGGTSHDERQREEDREPGPRERCDARANGTRLARAGDDHEEQRRERDAADGRAQSRLRRRRRPLPRPRRRPRAAVPAP